MLMNAQIKAYSRYVNPIMGRIGYLVFVPLLILFLLQAFLTGSADRVVLGLFGLLVCIGVPVKSWRDYQEYLRSLEAEGILSQVVADYADASAYLKGAVYLGERYVHVKGGISIAYGDICRAFPHVRKFLGANGVPVLILEDFEETIIASVTLPKRGQDRSGTREVLQALKEKNPQISLEAV